jgi:quinol monooxygenase YgiN
VSQLTIIATITAKAGHEADVRQALLDLIPPTRKEPGFIQYDLHESLDDPRVFVFYENWEDQASLDLHQATEGMAAHNSKTAPWIENVAIHRFRLLK